MSHSFTATATFTRTHAEHIAAKVATDLKRMQRFYGEPSDEWILKYMIEAGLVLGAGYLDTLTYGFQRNGRWIEPTISYAAQDLSGDAADDDPGRIRPRAPVDDASFRTYLINNSAWDELTPELQTKFDKMLPFQRTAAPEPDADGDWDKDLTYSAGGRALDRSSLKSRR